MKATKEEVGCLLDNLYLELLSLIEQQTACRVHIERLSNGGQLLLAKTRYVQGTYTVSVAQIPTEHSDEFKALARIEERACAEKVSGVEYTLVRHDVNRQDGYVEPMHWFGVLAPSSLRAAADQFKKCVQLVVDSYNLQREMLAVMDKIEQLKCIMKEQYVRKVSPHKEEILCENN